MLLLVILSICCCCLAAPVNKQNITAVKCSGDAKVDSYVLFNGAVVDQCEFPSRTARGPGLMDFCEAKATVDQKKEYYCTATTGDSILNCSRTGGRFVCRCTYKDVPYPHSQACFLYEQTRSLSFQRWWPNFLLKFGEVQ